MTIPCDKFPNISPMTYSKIRGDIRAGDILLCSGNGLFSSLIKRATQSVWSHVAFILPIPLIDRIMVLESVETIGVRTVPLSSYVRDYCGSGKPYDGRFIIARHDDFKETNVKHLSQCAVDLFGYPYGWTEIARIAGRVALWWAIKSEALRQSGNGYICSEYAYECFQSVGISICHDQRGFVAPADFARDPKIKAVFSILN